MITNFIILEYMVAYIILYNVFVSNSKEERERGSGADKNRVMTDAGRKIKVVVIGGPTCAGKSDLGLQLARRFGGEIVNADSMQVYKYFDIGTAKPDGAHRNEIRHHLVDIVEPDKEFNAALFKEAADSAISDIASRGMTPVVIGGTGLYIRALLYGLFVAPGNRDLRETLREEYSLDPLAFYEKLKDIDPEYALKISFRDKTRVVRAMEIFLSTGMVMSRWSSSHGFAESRYDALFICLEREREELYGRINDRVERMFQSGWIDEAQGILSMGYSEGVKPFSGIGYREILQYLKGFIAYGDMVKDIKKQTRHYAKRQFTWFAGEKGVEWHTYPEGIQNITTRAADFLRTWN